MSKALRPLIASIALVVLIVALVAGVLVVSARAEPIFAYRIIDPVTIEVEVTTGDYAWTRVTSVDETASQVMVSVKTVSIPFLPRASVGHETFLVVSLREPLGTRQVVGPSGQPIPRQ